MPLEPTQLTLAVFELTLLFAGGGLLLWLGFNRWQRQRWLETNALPYWQVSGAEFTFSVALVFLGAFFGQTAAHVLLGGLIGTGTDRAGRELLIYGGGMHGGALLGCLLFPLLRPRVFPDSASRGQPLRALHRPALADILRHAGGALLVALPILTVLSLGWLVLLRALGLPDDPQNIIETLTETKSALVMGGAMLVACVLAPVTEELVFRAGLYRVIRQRLGRLPALLISGILFGLLHGNWAGFLPLAVLGMLLAIVYEATGSIGVPIIAHGLFNLNSILIVLAGLSKVS